MTTYGVTAQGFVRKPYSVILEEMQTAARSGEYFGPEVDLSDENFIGMQLKLMAWACDRQWQLAEDTYYSMDMDNAEGVVLNRLAKLGLTERKDEQYASVYLMFSGEPSSPVPVGTQAETEQNIVFETIEHAVTDGSGSAVVRALCTITGESGNVAAYSIVNIKTPRPGIDSVVNTFAAEGGRGVETDAELRARYYDEPASSGSALAAIMAEVSDIQAVDGVIGLENEENAEDVNGLPAKSIELVVYGGTDDEVAEAIFKRKPAGIATHGNTTRQLIDSQGMSHQIKFSRPVEKPIWIKYILRVNSSVWETGQESIIINYAIDHINHQPPGSNVYDWKISARLADVSGIEDVTVLLGTTSGDITHDHIECIFRDRAQTDADKVMVEYE